MYGTAIDSQLRLALLLVNHRFDRGLTVLVIIAIRCTRYLLVLSALFCF
jgi:hypothetical protein